MTHPVLGNEQIEQFREDGFLIVENLFSTDEVQRILEMARRDPQIKAEAKFNKNYEGEGRDTRLVYSPRLGDDIYSALARSRRLSAPLEALFGGRVAHYYHLKTLKDPGTGGWQWHQDYGYHYKEFLLPDFVSAMVALDPATRENGCLQVVRGSNRLGRLDHRSSGSQLIADPHRVELALGHLEVVHCELAPGSVLYFHGNTLHASDANLSERSRWALIYAFVAASNPCVLEGAPRDLCTPIDPWSDARVEEAAQRYRERMGERAA